MEFKLATAYLGQEDRDRTKMVATLSTLTIMSNFPDFSDRGYQVIQQLGRNYLGGRVTYMATNTRTQQPVVIKHFQFALPNSEWSGFKAYEREIHVLQGLNHPGIPRYLDSFETTDGFCMVQEYMPAQSLASPRSFEPDDIKQIAISILEILVYLQNRLPPVIHRDIKPENILVNEQLNVYLVDFGFARIGGGEVAVSSVALGTLGFMPPEQLYNRQLTEATDLYSLGMTLICLLTKTKSTAVDTLINEDGWINFKSLVPRISLRFIDWLEKLVQPNPKNRYTNAAAALSAVKPIYVLRTPEVQLSASSLEFTVTRVGEKVSGFITISNPAPETTLRGNWEVAPHPSDPPHTPDYHAWISCTPNNFSANCVECEITIDTSKLMSDQLYSRQLLLRTNSSPETYPLTLKVQTAQLIEEKNLPYWHLIILYGLSGFVAFSLPHVVAFIPNDLSTLAFRIVVGALVGGTIGAANTNSKTLDWARIRNWAMLGALISFGNATGSNSVYELADKLHLTNYWLSPWLHWAGELVGAAAPILEVAVVKKIADKMSSKKFSKPAIWATILLTIGSGTSSGLNLILASNPFIVSALLGTGLPLAAIILYPQLQKAKLISKYRQAQQYLIKP